MNRKDINPFTKKGKLKSLYKIERELNQKIEGKRTSNKLRKRRNKNKAARASRKVNR